ncbi:sugar phosphate isomerase/epimerase [Microbacterium enclense]|uniref:sugar phosphate isomerase/epimerase family protein n=1 Tax=Microbacterium enclense TaxID=993073 RepID=UPI0021A859B8|nr:sugar phosphate isomerase/epimerase [Microbacterium enclense]MCT2086873.1 sugar phosphate isomerase/epimerase [Microbacterium enclense]
MSAPLRWAYALNQWNSPPTAFVRPELQTRALKTISVTGLDAVELQGGSGRWNNLGRPEHILLGHGSVEGFRAFLADSGIRRVSSMTWDPTAPAEEEGGAFRSTSNASDHAAIIEAAIPFVEFLEAIGAETFVVRASESAWRLPNGPSVADVATIMNALGRLCADRGVRLAVDIDCLSAFRPAPLGEALLAETDPATVGLAVDTAEYTVAGHDPVEVLLAHGERIAHVQLKDARAVDSTETYRRPFAESALLQGAADPGMERWFFELGTPGGLVDVPAVLEALRTIGYTGTVVVESDQSPTPATTALLNAWYLRSLGNADFPGGRGR